jgi:hypothetical protein
MMLDPFWKTYLRNSTNKLQVKFLNCCVIRTHRMQSTSRDFREQTDHLRGIPDCLQGGWRDDSDSFGGEAE